MEFVNLLNFNEITAIASCLDEIQANIKCKLENQGHFEFAKII